MIGATGSSSSLTAQTYQKMFAQIDRDQDGAISLDELMTIKTKDSKDDKDPAKDLLQSLDRNADGKLDASEFVPEKLCDKDTLGTMLTAQEYRDADPGTRAAANKSAVDALFERADVNGDGVLDQAEMEAEKTLNRMDTLDSGEMPRIAFLARVTEDGRLGKDDIIVGRMMSLGEQMSLYPDLAERLRDAAERMTPAPPPLSSPAGEGNSASEGADQPRGLDALRAQVVEGLNSKPLTSEMLSRLFARLSMGTFSTDNPVDRSA